MSDPRTLPLSDAVIGGRTVVSKTATILMTFLYGEDQSLSEIVVSTGLPLSTVHRLLCELTACRILERTEVGRYRITPSLRRIAAAPGPGASLESRASLVLHDLSQALDTEVRFGVLNTHRVAYIEKGRGRQPVTTFGGGATASAHETAMGMVLLAFSPRSVVDAAVLHALTSADVGSITTVERFGQTLQRIHLHQLAVRWDERHPDRSALAVPVFTIGGRIAAAIEARVGDASGHLSVVQSALVVAGRSLTRELSSVARRRGSRLDLPVSRVR
jgi:DNA-binding IclR family transcriptional regulator